MNRLIDCLLHPLFEANPAFILVDAILHGFVEKNPPDRALKFLRYNLARIVGELIEEKGSWGDVEDAVRFPDELKNKGGLGLSPFASSA